jgi:hypothetical protein
VEKRRSHEALLQTKEKQTADGTNKVKEGTASNPDGSLMAKPSKLIKLIKKEDL